MKCSCGASGFRGHLLMIRRKAVTVHVYCPQPVKRVR